MSDWAVQAGHNAGSLGTDTAVTSTTPPQQNNAPSSLTANRNLSQTHIWAPPSKIPTGCLHLQEWIDQTPNWKQVYGTVLRYVNMQHLQQKCGKIVMERPTCCDCGNAGGLPQRLLVSLHSVFVGCADNGCFIKHSQATEVCLSLDLDRGELFCVGCNDYVYDSAVEEVRVSVLEEIQVRIYSMPEACSMRECFRIF
jgi:hypothetical protein